MQMYNHNSKVLREGNNNRLYLYYYLILLVGYFLMSIPEIEYSNSIRIVFLGATLLPAIRSTTFFAFAIICFYSMTYIAFTPILPTSLWYYLPVVLLYYIIKYKSTQNITVQFLCLLYYLLVCIIYGDFQLFVLCFFVAIMTCSFIKDNKQLDYFAIALMVSSIILSVIFYTNMDAFVYAYGGGHDQDRYGWINPNEYAGAVGCGGVVAMHYLFGKTQRDSKWITLISYIALLASFIVIVINASRGAALSFGIVLVLFMLFSKKGTKYKLLSIIMVTVGFIYLLKSNISEFLFVRLSESSMATGSGRWDIWSSKLEWFLSNTNLFEFFVGIGREACINIPPVISTHNDFLTALIGYGLVGFLLMIIMFIRPIIKASKSHRIAVILMTLYLVLECSVLEPLFRGYFTFIVFFIYIYKCAIVNKDVKI